MKKMIAFVLIAAGLTACNPLEGKTTQTSNFDQSSLCTWTDENELKQCKEGQLGFFAPASFGNDQLPLLVVARYCDLRHQIVQNNGGVVCVITHQRTPKAS